MSVLGQAFTACNSTPPSLLNTALGDIFHFTKQSSRQALLASGQEEAWLALLQEQIQPCYMAEKRSEWIVSDRSGVWELQEESIKLSSQ